MTDRHVASTKVSTAQRDALLARGRMSHVLQTLVADATGQPGPAPLKRGRPRKDKKRNAAIRAGGKRKR